MIAVAGKTPVFKTGEINGLVAFSKHKLSQNYKRGDGSYAQDSEYMIPLEQHPESYLAKFAVKPDQNSEIKLSARTYKNNIGGRDINSKTYMLESKYNPSKLVDLSLLMSHSKTSQIYDEDARLWTIQKASTKNTSNYLDIHNKSEINLAKNTDLTLKYGATYLKNNYLRTVPFEGNDIEAIRNLALSPAGTQETKSLYFNTELNWGIVSLTPEISYSHYKLTGISPACDSDDAVYCTIPEEVKINNKHNIVNPSIGLAVNMTDWLQPFARYYHTSRPVNVQEMFNTSRNGLTVNSNLRPEKAKTYELGLNISKDKLFTNNDIFGLKVIYFKGLY
ncbi:MAG: TonB-dependent receptor [Pasteurellaceae bacterium]|nr:TonB-dependent receptor [Pasteurellaceae bacterium]